MLGTESAVVAAAANARGSTAVAGAERGPRNDASESRSSSDSSPTLRCSAVAADAATTVISARTAARAASPRGKNPVILTPSTGFARLGRGRAPTRSAGDLIRSDGRGQSRPRTYYFLTSLQILSGERWVSQLLVWRSQKVQGNEDRALGRLLVENYLPPSLPQVEERLLQGSHGLAQLRVLLAVGDLDNGRSCTDRQDLDSEDADRLHRLSP